MKVNVLSKILAMTLVMVMVIGLVPATVLADLIDYEAHDSYYKVITKDDYQLAPGIVESEIVLNNATGTHRQVAHVVEVDLSNPYAKVLPSYKGMVPTPGSYGVQIMSEQAKWAEENGYGNVVAAMNLSLSWYDNAYYTEHPELVGEPLGYMVLNGEVYMNSQGQSTGAQTCVVINFDEKDGEARPADMAKVEIRSTSSAITGWEEQVIPANFGFLVKDGVNQYSVDNNAANGASRSFVGIKEDGTFVMVMNDGRQSPYSAGFTSYEMAEFMLSLGCVQAINGDGGGSSAFLSQRPGEELKLNCSPSDGAERPTTHGILVISTAPATGEFVRANITVDNDYYTPGSTIKFNALGTDLVGTVADIPEDAVWQLADPTMGTIEDGVFVSNGKVGTVTAQMVWNGEVVGSASVEIVVPTEFSFSQEVMTVPFDKEVTIGFTATINDGVHSVVLKPEDVTLSTTNSALGTFDGFKFTSVSEANAPADLKSTLTATLVHNTELVATATLNLGKGSEVLFDFESSSDVDEWKTGVVNGYHTSGFKSEISFADTTNGQVHDGNGALRLETNGLSAVDVSAGGYAQVPIYLNNGVIVENALSIGFWIYIPDEYESCWIRVLYWYDSDGNGTYDKKNTVTVINQPEVYNTWDESGWKYFSVDVSKYSSILIPGVNDSDDIFPAANHTNKGTAKEPNDYRFIEFMFPHTNTNDLWKTHGTLNGPYTIYIDNITADFSDAVDDREAPIFGTVSLAANDTAIDLEKYNTVKTTNNLLTVTASVAEDTTKTNATGLDVSSAKAYVDGVEVDVTYANGRMTISDVAVADGIHRVKFEICDNMGNKAVVIRLVEVDSGVDASTVTVVPADPTLDRLYGGSVYWMNVNANKIETIKSVKAVIDLNSVNHWELDHMVLADGFTATYSVDEENNTATIVITRTGENTQTGAVTLASLPIRVIYYDTDINIEGYTAETYWTEYDFWPYDLKVDVDMGEITYVDGYTSDVLGAFSNEEFSVDIEMYTVKSAMDTTFYDERGTAHVHTPESVDVSAGCTTIGYSGRTYCAVCDSIVEWGTVLPATGIHAYDFVDGKLVCTAGGELFNGVYTDGKTYVDGVVIADGWVEESYYKDGVMLTGVNVIDGKYYNFGDDGICANKYPMSAEWWTNENGETFYMNAGVPVTGYAFINPNPAFFDKNGVAFDGEIVISGETCVFDKGVFVKSTTAEVILAGLAGPDAYFILYADGTLILSGEGATFDYVSTGSSMGPNISWKNRPWGNQYNNYCKSIKKIVVGKDITEIGVYTFYLCVNVTEVTFEEGSALHTINNVAFCYLPELKSLTLPESLVTVDGRAFAYNGKLVNVYVPHSVTYIHPNAFISSEKVLLDVAEGSYGESYAIKNNIAYKTREFVGTLVVQGSCGANATWEFYDNGKLAIGGSGAMYDFSGRDNQPWAAYRERITAITIGKDITYIGKYAFAYAYNVKSISFAEGSQLERIGTASIYYMLYLEELVIPESVKTIDGLAIAYNSKLASVYVPQGIMSIHVNAFINSKKIVLNVAEGTYANNFAVNNNIAYTTRPYAEALIAEGTCGTNITWKLYEDGKLVVGGIGAMPDFESRNEQPWAEYREMITQIVIGKDVTYIGKFAFAYSYNVNSVIFEDGSKLESIGTAAIYYMLYLEELVLPESVRSLGSISIAYNSKLVNVYIPQGIVSIGVNAFTNSKKVVLDVVEGSYAEDYAVKNSIAYTTRESSDILAEGTCGSNATWVLYANGKLVIGGSGAMADYSSRNEQPWSAYREVITDIVIGKDITHIGKFAFAYAYNVKSVTFEEGSKLESVGAASVYYMLYVEEIILPETVKNIDGLAFAYCSKLNNVSYPATAVVHENAFLNSPCDE